jgi:homoserine O-acetyltransferase/O-succinyltransferase
MKKFIFPFIVAIILFAWCTVVFGQSELQFADLGNYALENGQTIKDCRLAYRTFGVLNKDKSNAVLFPTWLAGTTQDLIDLGFIGPGRLADSSKYFIVAVEAFGNGVSSSPSNSKAQQHKAFPQFSIKDMVNAQHLLLTKYMQVPRLYSVVGISMGAMMAYQWMVSYPDFLNKTVAVAGSPRLTLYDLLFWQAELGAIDAGLGTSEQEDASMKYLAVIHTLHLTTPHYIALQAEPKGFPQFLANTQKSLMKYNVYDWAWQLKAIMDQDIFRSFGEAVDPAIKTMRAKALIVWARQDLTVNPEPAQLLAKSLQADTFEFTGDCGHLSFLCERDALSTRVNRFLDETGRQDDKK